MPINRPISRHAAERILQFRQEVEAKGGRLILSLPWVYGSNGKKTRENVQKTAYVLSQIAPLVYNPETLNIKSDSGLFADTHYHLLPHAREIRAKQLVEQLEPIVKN